MITASVENQARRNVRLKVERSINKAIRIEEYLQERAERERLKELREQGILHTGEGI